MALIVHTVALQAVVALRPLVAAIARHDRSLADQLRRAASSVVLNIAEAEASSAGQERLRLGTARGSAREARSALALGAAWGYLAPGACAQADALLDRTGAMLWPLVRSPARR